MFILVIVFRYRDYPYQVRVRVNVRFRVSTTIELHILVTEKLSRKLVIKWSFTAHMFYAHSQLKKINLIVCQSVFKTDYSLHLFLNQTILRSVP